MTFLEKRLLELEKQVAAGFGSGLLAADFLEFGRSGKTYTRAAILQSLKPGKRHSFTNYRARKLAPGLWLTTFRTTNPGPRGTWIKPALRTSIWKKTKSGFRMLFHQATPAA